MFSSRSFFIFSWTVLLASVSSLVFCTILDLDHLGVDVELKATEILEVAIQHVADSKETDSKCSKSGPLSLLQVGTAINRDILLQPEVSKLEKPQKVLEAIALKSGKNGLGDMLKKITGTDIFLEILDSCRSARSKPRCDAKSPYRTYDGSCNNLKYPLWGSVLSCNERILPASYVETSGFRKSVKSDKDLPEPRYLSLNMLTNYHYPTKDVSNLFTFFGQVVDHDITNTAPSTANGGVLQCCPPEKNAPAQCAPILISPDDPFYSDHNITCINFVRNAPCPTCTFGKRIQINTVSAFIDCSFLYSVSKETAKQIRTMKGGMLKMHETDAGPLLPPNPDTDENQCCKARKQERCFKAGMLKMHETDAGPLLPPNPNTDENQCGKACKQERCFKAGDGRVNQHTLLMILQTLFARLHNIIAERLGDINPNWDDEKIFQEARKIVIGITQNIIYKEYLPPLVGKKMMTKYNLWIDDDCRTEYDPTVNAAMLTEFTTAAFRLHPMVNGVAVEGGLKFRLLYNFASPIYRGHMDELVVGMTETPSQKFGPHLVDDVKNFLYRSLDGDSGLDLSSINLQRGRDHGVPPYVVVCEHFMGNKTRINTFDDLDGIICSEYIELLKECYDDVRDIDLWPGLLMECPKKYGILGKTAAHIIAMQFAHLRNGDRYFFDIEDQPGSFTCEQLEEIKKSSLSGILCQTTHIEKMHEKALLLPNDNNPLMHCSDIPTVDLKWWKSDSSY